MCGVCGTFASDNHSLSGSQRSVVTSMVSMLRHRGPDASGVWLDPSGLTALGHARLAIVDLSDAGAQPMTSQDGRWTITYNGELYNADNLRRSLHSVHWHGHSDTEVLVEYISRHGVLETLRAAKGMFAFGC